MKFIVTKVSGGRRYFLLLHPRVPIAHLFGTGAISEDELFEINDMLNDLGQQPIDIGSELPKESELEPRVSQ